ncbi:hypothetical protein DH2020_045227 [Rehmannia glutinosa]|uniref:mitogen-activated protein kinase kinase kinase n=1 Tax=Rehmannia glutinosa TaxID=99300 RepID=A0ABR0UEX3_REHGL
MMSSKHKKQQLRPRLDRRNAIKNIDYDAGESGLTSPASSDDRSVYKTRSLDLLPLAGRTSFRIEGVEGEVDQIFRYLGLGPDDFSIPVAAWEARKSLSPSSNLKTAERVDRSDLPNGFGARVGVSDGEVKDGVELKLGDIRVSIDEDTENEVKNKLISHGGWGIRGIRPPKLTPPLVITRSIPGNTSDSGEFRDIIEARIKIGNGEEKDGAELILGGDEVRVNEQSENEVRSEFMSNDGLVIGGTTLRKLAPPPVMMRSIVVDKSSTWDIFKAFGPKDDHDLKSPRDLISHTISEVEEESEVERRMQEESEDVKKERGAGLESCSDSSNGEDGSDSVCLVGENDHTVSPNGSFRSNIMSWQKGDFLGSGSFGTVYEGFTDDGFFFAVKEVSLLDQGSQGQQSIHQLEQEISLLRQFRHENIVRYLGTDKDEAKLYIFLELVTKGSLARLYQKYQLRDSQVSAYTRQILSGLNYLHCRNVVHRDIKCANILVDVSGSVKLADFGLAKATKLNDIKSCKGTPFWMAPEVVNRRNHGYGRAADIWSLGCTVLEMLTGQIPYSHLEGPTGHSDSCNGRFRKITAALSLFSVMNLNISLSEFFITMIRMQALFRIGRGELPPIPNTLSRDAQDFILKCLQVNPDDRPTAAQLLEHPFVKKLPSTFPSPVSPHYAVNFSCAECGNMCLGMNFYECFKELLRTSLFYESKLRLVSRCLDFSKVSMDSRKPSIRACVSNKVMKMPSLYNMRVCLVKQSGNKPIGYS